MPYHIKKSSPFGGDVYWVSGQKWTYDYASRKVYATESGANNAAAKMHGPELTVAGVEQPRSYTHQPQVISE